MPVILVVAVILLSLTGQNPAQQKPETISPAKSATAIKKESEQKPESREGNSQKADTNGSSEKRLTENQEYALFHLRKLQSGLKELDDLKTKIEAQGRIADALWSFDPDDARQQFKNALQAIDDYKKTENNPTATTKTIAEEDTVSIKQKLRTYLLNLLSRNDFDLADKFVKAGNSDTKTQKNETESPRLELARNIAEANPEQALSIAKEEIKIRLDEETIATLAVVRRSTLQADAVFLDLLTEVENNKTFYSYYNLGLLGSYIMSASGDSSLGFGKEYNPTLSERYINVVYKIIEFDLQNNKSIAKDEFSYGSYVLQMLLPVFDKYQPKESSKVRAYMNNLRAKSAPAKKPQSSADDLDELTVENLVDLANKTTDLAKQNRLFTRAAFLAARQNDYDKAFSLIDKISDTQQRNDYSSTLHYQAGRNAVTKRNIEQAIKHGREISIPIQRWMVLLPVVDLKLTGKDKNGAKELLIELKEYLEQLEDSDPSKAQGLFEIANYWDKANISGKNELIPTAIKSLNFVDFDKPPKIKGRAKVTPEQFTAESLWHSLASVDFEQALSLARMIENKYISTMAQISICKTMLKDIKK